MSIQIEKIRDDFPALRQKFNGMPVIYFDNACTTLTPSCVIEAMQDYYYKYPGCYGRGIHKFGNKTNEKCQEAREKIARLIHVDSREVIFLKNTTEGINLIANSIELKDGDVVLTAEMEHNSNFLPWRLLSKNRGVIHKLIPLKNDFSVDLDKFKNIIDDRVKLVSVFYTSNVTGVTNPVKEIINISHRYNALTLLDAAQAVQHRVVDVKGLDADFFAFSVHKMLGPRGVGVLYGKSHLLDSLPQIIVGGESAENVTFSSFLPSRPPEKFEAGLQNYPGIIGSGAAVDYLMQVGLNTISQQEYELNCLLTEEIKKIKNIIILGPAEPDLRSNILNFIVEGMDSNEVAHMLDETSNIMVRSGMHCAHSWYNKEVVPPSIRVSLCFYNTEKEVRVFVKSLKEVIKYFK
jgi:cysteine desulfurase/selenocysteine lyase